MVILYNKRKQAAGYTKEKRSIPGVQKQDYKIPFRVGGDCQKRKEKSYVSLSVYG